MLRHERLRVVSGMPKSDRIPGMSNTFTPRGPYSWYDCAQCGERILAVRTKPVCEAWSPSGLPLPAPRPISTTMGRATPISEEPMQEEVVRLCEAVEDLRLSLCVMGGLIASAAVMIAAYIRAYVKESK